MATAEDVLNIARGELGYYAPDDPEPGSKYGRWMADVTGEDWLRGPSREIWWCCCFSSWCLAQAGVECPGFPSYNTDLVLSANPPRVPLSQALPGDIVIWDWDGNGATDHIGIIEDPRVMITIEGNKDNAVKRVNRSSVNYLVRAVIRPAYSGVEGDHERPSASDPVAGMAQLVIDGRYGNYPERVDNLYREVQSCVDALWFGADVSGYPSAVVAFAQRVINGDYGNYPERVGNIYATVQAAVDAMYH